MEVRIKFRDSDARMVLGLLRHKYKTKAGIERLAKRVIWEAVHAQATAEFAEARQRYEDEQANDE